jgi:hypothetical protein
MKHTACVTLLVQALDLGGSGGHVATHLYTAAGVHVQSFAARPVHMHAADLCSQSYGYTLNNCGPVQCMRRSTVALLDLALMWLWHECNH